MNARRMHHARWGVLALLLSLPACTVAIGAAPDGAGGAASSPRAQPRDRIFIRASTPAEDAAEERIVSGAPAPGASLVIPVRGIGADQLSDSYRSPRSGGRMHNAIDIMAPAGAPVVAAADGTIRRLRTGGMGGITIYQVGSDGVTLYYYAHLQRYAAGIREGLPVQAGQVIAYVGDTGNAGTGNYHLHFSVGRLTDPARWWESENVNPYPLLAGERAYYGGASGGNRR